MLDTEKIDFSDPQIKANPYPLYARLREEAPVCRVRLWGVPGWLVTRYDDVAAALKDDRLASDRRRAPTSGRPLREKVINRMTGALNRSMLSADEPDHRRLRNLVQKAFTQQRVEDMRSRIERLTEQLVDAAIGRKQMDIVHDYALPLPATIIAEMLGVPAADRDRFHRWSDAMLTLTSMDFLDVARVVPTIVAFRQYIRQAVRLRRRQPGDDLISALVVAEEAGEKLSEDETVGMIFLLLIAGHETTVNLIGNGVLALLDNPDQMAKLRSGQAPMPLAVEELLRYDSPLELANPRWTLSKVSLGGVTIPPGEPVICNLASANRDPKQFDRADALDITREPNRHMAFGQGVHYCLGAFLARLEAQVAFTTLLRRIPQLRLAVPRAALAWRNSLVLRGLQALPVTWEHRSVPFSRPAD